MLRTSLKFGVALAVLTATGQAAYAVGIGSVTQVVNAAYRTPPGEDETPAKVNDTVVSDETLRTEEGSSIAVKFVRPSVAPAKTRGLPPAKPASNPFAPSVKAAGPIA